MIRYNLAHMVTWYHRNKGIHVDIIVLFEVWL